jgi:hypothetical protein
VADQPAHIDVTIPDTGWERVHLDPDTQDPWLLDVLSGPAPAWLYDAVRTADKHHSGLHLHPAEFHRLQRADWAMASRLHAEGPLLGCRLIVDPSIPQGIVRIHTTQPADWLAYL